MSTILFTAAKASKRVSFILQPLYSSSFAVRHASINSGINRGLRKSKGAGFRGKERSSSSRDDDGGGQGFQTPRSNPYTRDRRDTADDFGGRKQSMHSSVKGYDRNDKLKSKNKNPYPFKDRRDVDSHANGRRGQPERFGERGFQKGESFGRDRESKRSYEPRDSPFREKTYRNLDEASKVYGTEYPASRGVGIGGRHISRQKWGEGHAYPSKYPTREERLAHKAARSGSSPEPPVSNPESISPPVINTTSKFEKHIPITLPYTTPASEFLYGTSVVEAALNARTRKGRKLYKLYIHKGEDRQSADRDSHIARLAQRRGVELQIVKGFDWLRTLDKMSQGRPHNGYILEASPLPRLPVTGLGEVIDQNDSFDINLALDHQSREEKEINGTDTLINIPKDPTGRKPLILFLDSILDPQNLGALLRSAAFMGVTAVAVSTHNSAPFSPIVFKASAGATETIELFTVNKPGSFIQTSQSSGWKIYAAVAPPAPDKSKSEPRSMWPTKKPVWTHDLQDPLRENPCILMLGGEGEGLRHNLISQADVHISIKGAAAGTRASLDSLNVSVAAGILCDAFMRQTSRATVKQAVQKVEEETENLGENRLF